MSSRSETILAMMEPRAGLPAPASTRPCRNTWETKWLGADRRSTRSVSLRSADAIDVARRCRCCSRSGAASAIARSTSLEAPERPDACEPNSTTTRGTIGRPNSPRSAEEMARPARSSNSDESISLISPILPGWPDPVNTSRTRSWGVLRPITASETRAAGCRPAWRCLPRARGPRRRPRRRPPRRRGCRCSGRAPSGSRRSARCSPRCGGRHS